MQITIRVKQAGRKRALIESQKLEIENIGERPTLKVLLEAVVRQQVEEYNRKAADTNLLPFLSRSEIVLKAESGKVGFGGVYNENKADVSEAQATALQAFDDGLFAVFVGDDELNSLDAVVRLTETSVITFIRLAFLAGSYW